MDTQGSAGALTQAMNANIKIGGGNDVSKAEHSPLGEKRKSSFQDVTSNFDRLYNKRIDFDRIAAEKMTLEDKQDYLDVQLRKATRNVSLP